MEMKRLSGADIKFFEDEHPVTNEVEHPVTNEVEEPLPELEPAMPRLKSYQPEVHSVIPGTEDESFAIIDKIILEDIQRANDFDLMKKLQMEEIKELNYEKAQIIPKSPPLNPLAKEYTPLNPFAVSYTPSFVSKPLFESVSGTDPLGVIPVSSPPVTSPPVTFPPVTSPPVTSPPVTFPVISPPVTKSKNDFPPSYASVLKGTNLFVPEEKKEIVPEEKKEIVPMVLTPATPLTTTAIVAKNQVRSNIYRQFFEACRAFNYSQLRDLLKTDVGQHKDAICAVITSGWYEAVLLITQEMPYPFGFAELQAAIEASDKTDKNRDDARLNPIYCISAVADIAIFYDDRDEWKKIFALTPIGPKLEKLIEVFNLWSRKNDVVLNVQLVMTEQQRVWFVGENARVEGQKQQLLLKAEEDKKTTEIRKYKELHDELDRQKALQDKAYHDGLVAAQKAKEITVKIEEAKKGGFFSSMFGFFRY